MTLVRIASWSFDALTCTGAVVTFDSVSVTPSITPDSVLLAERTGRLSIVAIASDAGRASVIADVPPGL